jgi:hypothetical protein
MFLKLLRLLVCLPLLASCQNETDKSEKKDLKITFGKAPIDTTLSHEKVVNKRDTLPKEKYAPLFENDKVLTDDTLSFELFLKKTLDSRPKEPFFLIDSILIEGHGQDMLFYQGNLFSKKYTHAVVFYDEFSFVVFKKENKNWKTIDRLNATKGKPNYNRNDALKGKSPLTFSDFNKDGVGDLLIEGHSMGGHCSCNYFNFYLFDEKNDTFIGRIAFTDDKNFVDGCDVYPTKNKNEVYVGDHCDGYFFRCQWEGFNLVKKEGYQFSGADGGSRFMDKNDSKNKDCERKHVRFEKGKAVIIDKTKTCDLPKAWNVIFNVN